MTYQVLARKWRPQDFAALIGQQAVVTALSNAVAEGRVAQAYLFSGIRGVGKTTAARVLAKALNCERFGVGKAGGPCNECRTCSDITAGADLDVLEIDAATYSKVEQVRELAESLKYGPARDRYKVVVLDEVHRLSRQAFDALLKIIEEPPAHLVFIFATTEIDAVPATILSRCQEFHFRRVSNAELKAHLATIAAAEKIAASDAALSLIARAGEGSVRDAVAILDQLATFGGGTVDESEAARLLGGIDLALFHDLLAAIIAGDSAVVSELARRVEDNGWDPRQVHANFLAYCRDALHLALGESAEKLALPGDEQRRLATLATKSGYENLLRLLHQLLASESAIRRSESGALALEIAWLRAAELPKLVAIEAFLAGEGLPATPAPPTPPAGPTRGGPRRIAPAAADAGGTGPSPAETRTAPQAETRSAPSAETPAPRSEPRPESSAASRPQPGPTPTVATPAAPPAPAPPRERTPPREGEEVAAFLEEVNTRDAKLAGLVEGLASIAWRAAERELAITPETDFAATSLKRAANRELLEAAAVQALGAGAAVRLLPPRPAAKKAPTPEAATRDASLSAAREHPFVQSVLSVFGGDVADVSSPSSGSKAAGTSPVIGASGASEASEPSEPEEPKR